MNNSIITNPNGDFMVDPSYSTGRCWTGTIKITPDPEKLDISSLLELVKNTVKGGDYNITSDEPQTTTTNLRGLTIDGGGFVTGGTSASYNTYKITLETNRFMLIVTYTLQLNSGSRAFQTLALTPKVEGMTKSPQTASRSGIQGLQGETLVTFLRTTYEARRLEQFKRVQTSFDAIVAGIGADDA
jgi:hypothetical protein